MTQEEAYEKLQDLLALADAIVGEHYEAEEIVEELEKHLGLE